MAALLTTTMLIGGGLGADVSAEEVTASPTTPSLMVPGVSFAPLVKSVTPAVVNIATTEKVERHNAGETPEFPPGSPFGEMFRQFQHRSNNEPRHALGSGFIIDPAGYIVTNNHVVDGAQKITVTLSDGTEYPATKVGTDAKTDLAVLKIDAKKTLPYVSFGDSTKEEVGDWVIAVGNPFGLGGSVTAGIVSAFGRNIDAGSYDNFIQIDAAINPGNSGGPLFDQSGKVIGIDTAIYSPNGGSVGIGFAIPSNLAKPIVAQLRDHGSVQRGWLGVQMQPLTPELAKAYGRPNNEGVLVNQVVADSPAARAKLQQGDVITAYNGTLVKTTSDLAIDVANTKAGDTAHLTVWRDGQSRTVDVTIGTQKGEKLASLEKSSEDGAVGIGLAPLTASDRQELALDPGISGVIVSGVDPDSSAAESGIRPGDVIVRVGNAAVTTPAEARDKIHLAQKEKREALPLLVIRDGTTYYLALDLSKT